MLIPPPRPEQRRPPGPSLPRRLVTNVATAGAAGGEEHPAGRAAGPRTSGPRIGQAGLLHGTRRAAQTRVAAMSASSPCSAASRSARPACGPSRPCHSSGVRRTTLSRRSPAAPTAATASVTPAPCAAETVCSAGDLRPAVRPVAISTGRPSARPDGERAAAAGARRNARPAPAGDGGSGSTATATPVSPRSPSPRSRYGPSSGGTHGPRPSCLRTARSRSPSQRSTVTPASVRSAMS